MVLQTKWVPTLLGRHFCLIPFLVMERGIHHISHEVAPPYLGGRGGGRGGVGRGVGGGRGGVGGVGGGWGGEVGGGGREGR